MEKGRPREEPPFSSTPAGAGGLQEKIYFSSTVPPASSIFFL